VETTEWLLQEYEAKGYVLLEGAHVEIPSEIERLTRNSPYSEIYHESDGQTPRSYYGFHQDPSFVQWLEKQTLLRKVLEEILPGDVYLHQSKVNLKNRNASSTWPYHRDFPFWNVFDNIARNQMVNLVIFMDHVTAENGALTFIPGSQHHFLDREIQNQRIEFSLEGSASSDLLFDFTDEEVQSLSNRFGIHTCTGPKGSLLAFDPDTIHGSLSATEDNCRRLMILTFNHCDNLPTNPSPRPEFLCSTHFSPIAWK
jgi:ectoine hydroxylase